MMRFRWFGLVLVAALAVFAVPTHAQYDGEQITHYAVMLVVNTDASVVVREDITYDFGATERHGIFRDIPLAAPAPWYHLRITDVVVADSEGASYQAALMHENGQLRIRIGDPNTTVNGIHHYNITYKVQGAIRYFDQYEEIYWNAIGTGWSVPITDVQVAVVPPTDDVIASRCYVGTSGSQSPCTSAQAAGTAISFVAPLLQPTEGMTVAVSWPRGVVAAPSIWLQAWELLKLFWLCPLPLIVGLIMLWRWWRFGRDSRGRETIITQFDPPPTLTPIEAGTIFDEWLQGKDLTAEIIYLATQGYLKITRQEAGNFWKRQGTYTLQRLSKIPPTLSIEAQLLAILFPASAHSSVTDVLSAFKSKATTEPVSDQAVTVTTFPDDRDRLARSWPTVERQVYKQLTAKGYFVSNPATTRLMYYLSGGALLLLGFFLLGSLLLALPIMISGALIGIFGSFMPAKTAKGVAVREHLLGLKRYIEVAEKDRLAFHNAPDKTPERFEALLPYAILLGVDRAWVKQFGELQQPTWYQDSHGFQAMNFAGVLTEFQSVTAASMSQSSGSGGGGSSGGGSGGGGGGSW